MGGGNLGMGNKGLMAEYVGSICWSCRNARADRCAWANKLSKVWEKADVQFKKESSGRRYKVYVVRECKKYEPDEVGAL